MKYIVFHVPAVNAIQNKQLSPVNVSVNENTFSLCEKFWLQNLQQLTNFSEVGRHINFDVSILTAVIGKHHTGIVREAVRTGPKTMLLIETTDFG